MPSPEKKVSGLVKREKILKKKKTGKGKKTITAHLRSVINIRHAAYIWGREINFVSFVTCFSFCLRTRPLLLYRIIRWTVDI
jgi:hypothetical protein